MVLKAVQTYVSDQSDVFGLLPKLDGLAGLLSAQSGHWPRLVAALCSVTEPDFRCRRNISHLSDLVSVDRV